MKGIYHVMLRGINRQNIFEEKDDYLFFDHCLEKVQTPLEENRGTGTGRTCNIYAYCCMSNHVHLLIQEQDASISEVMKRLANSYVTYYNKKYERNGHLFQNRFRSEPCDDVIYFFTLFRYIHLNPVKGGICSDPADYPYSSWRTDYLYKYRSICRTDLMYKMKTLDELKDLMQAECDYQGVDKNGREGYRMSNLEVHKLLESMCGYTNVAEFQRFPIEEQYAIIAEAKNGGASIRQLARLTGISEGIIRRL